MTKIIAGIEMTFAYYLEGKEVWSHKINGKEYLYHLNTK